MAQLREEFSNLGFDLLGLDNLIYLSKVPEEPPACPYGYCDGGCSAGCLTCSPGNKDG